MNHVDVAIGALIESLQTLSHTAPPRTEDQQVYANGPARILIAQRPKDGVLGGYWELPGGKLEDGETPAQCLVREFEEELGITVEPYHALETIEHHYSHADVRLHPLLCRRISGQPQAIAVEQFLWAPLEDLPRYPFPEASLGLMQTLSTLRPNM